MRYFQGSVVNPIRRRSFNPKFGGLILVDGLFAAPFSKEFNMAMLTPSAIALQRWLSELPGTSFAILHT